MKKMFQSGGKGIMLDYDGFLEELLDPKNRLHIEILNLTRVPPEWTLSNRVLSFHYLTLVADSINSVEADGFTKDIGQGGFLWLNPGVRHCMQPHSKAHPHQFYHLQFALFREACPVLTEEPLIFLPNAGELQEPFNALRDVFQQGGAYSEELLRSHLCILICELFRLRERPFENKRKLTRFQRKTIDDLFQNTATGGLSPQMLAEEVKLSPDYFRRVFKNTYGYSPKSWIARERMRQAALLIGESNLSITEIAALNGYDDVYVFSKLFKKYNGKSPRHYRDSLFQ